MTKDDKLSVIFKAADGETQTLADDLMVQIGEVVDAATLSKNKLCEFLQNRLIPSQEFCFRCILKRP